MARNSHPFALKFYQPHSLPNYAAPVQLIHSWSSKIQFLEQKSRLTNKPAFYIYVMIILRSRRNEHSL